MAKREETKKDLLTKKASSVLAWIDQNPILKLVGIAWVVFMSAWTPYDGYRRSRLEAERSGLTYEPSTLLMLSANEATLVNSGNRSVAEATLSWHYYMLQVQPCSIKMSGGRNSWKPAAEAHELRPLGELKASFPTEDLTLLCRNRESLRLDRLVSGAPPIIIEFRAQYYRAADLKAYTTSRYAFVGDGCKDLEPLENAYSVQGDTLLWKDQERQRAWACLNASRDSDDQQLRRFENSSQRSEQLLQLEKNISK